MKSKTTAGILALLLGGIGIHRFYLGEGSKGLLYLLFCWTLIPLVVSIFDAIIFFGESETAWNAKYNKEHVQMQELTKQALRGAKSADWADQVAKLHDLKEKGIITEEEYEARKKRLG